MFEKINTHVIAVRSFCIVNVRDVLVSSSNLRFIKRNEIERLLLMYMYFGVSAEYRV